MEFSTPSFGQPADDVVVFRDIDVFATPVREVVATLLGLQGGKEGGYLYTAPEL